MEKRHFCFSIWGRSSHFQRRFLIRLGGLLRLLVFKLRFIFPLEQAVMKYSERFLFIKRVWRCRCRYLKLLQVLKKAGWQSQGGAQFSKLQWPVKIQAQRSGAVGIGVCEVGSLVGGTLRSWGNRGFQRGDRLSSVDGIWGRALPSKDMNQEGLPVHRGHYSR